ncbi:MAG: hypothetical protein APF84_09540 [Gracilibacter sp. BRH_c7a]|nr:MAG: hypothetical protein APF84_09540 [Gracilibacter sp. BRH_c7a]
MEQRVVFYEDLCKGCSLCVSVCPTNVIHLAEHINVRGYRPAEVNEQHKCISCAACARICPDVVITVFREERKKAVS